MLTYSPYHSHSFPPKPVYVTLWHTGYSGEVAYTLQIEMLFVAVVKVVGRPVTGVWTHKVRKLKSDDFFNTGFSGCFQLEKHLFPLYRQKVYRHIPIETFAVAPAGDTVFFCQTAVDLQIISQLIKIAVTILKSHNIQWFRQARKECCPTLFHALRAYRRHSV